MKKLFILILLIPFSVNGLTESVVNIDTLSIEEIQEYVDKGYLTYEQITKIYLERIEEYNEQYNAIITINENAIEQARNLDIEYKEKGRRSLMHGIPILVKDNIDVKGLPTTAGASGLLDSYPYENNNAINNLIEAGTIILAKTNMDEFAFNASYSYSSFGYVYNAYNVKYSSYGSSGGTAVGVASNLAVAGIGSDTGSSIRIPSSANNLVGLRPTYGLVDTNGVIKFESLRDVIGPITKYVSDNAIMLEIMDNTDKNYTSNFTLGLNGVKIGVLKSIYNNSSSFIKELMRNQIDTLEQLGAEVIYIDTFYPTYKFDATTFCSDFNDYIKGTSSQIKSLDDLIKSGNYTQYIDSYNGYYCNNDYRTTTSYQSYLNLRNNNIKYVNEKFNDLDAIIYPTLQTELIKMSNIHSTKLKTFSSNIAPLVGFPSMNVPMGFYNNLPYGMEILSKANNEDIIYKIAYNLEKENSYYVLPSIAKSLYEISPNMSTLLSYYEEEKIETEYISIKNKIKNFINDYNSINDKEKIINDLISEYENIPNIIEENKLKKEENTKLLSKSVISCVTSVILLVIIILLKR